MLMMKYDDKQQVNKKKTTTTHTRTNERTREGTGVSEIRHIYVRQSVEDKHVGKVGQKDVRWR